MPNQKTGNARGGKTGKAQLLETIAEDAGISRKQARAALESLNQTLTKQLKGSGIAVIPKLVKFSVVVKPATPEREGINPFTKQPTIFKAKPERKVVKARPLKGLKDGV